MLISIVAATTFFLTAVFFTTAGAFFATALMGFLTGLSYDVSLGSGKKGRGRTLSSSE